MKFKTLLILLLLFSFTAGHTNQTAQIKTNAQKIENTYHGKVGFSALNTANGEKISYHGNNRFPMCSTSKLMVVAAILKHSMLDHYFLNRKILITQMMIETAGYAPITKKYLNKEMTTEDLSIAAITESDNVAANLLIKILGGTDAVTEFARSMGDYTFRLDRIEPELNEAKPNDPRDTTTPNATTISLQRLLFGNVLAAKQKFLLKTWLENNKTGDNRIRASTPSDWTVGDKTGTCHYGTTNDIGVIWPIHSPPIILSIYFTQPKKDAPPKDQVIQNVTQMVLKILT